MIQCGISFALWLLQILYKMFTDVTVFNKLNMKNKKKYINQINSILASVTEPESSCGSTNCWSYPWSPTSLLGFLGIVLAWVIFWAVLTRNPWWQYVLFVLWNCIFQSSFLRGNHEDNRIGGDKENFKKKVLIIHMATKFLICIFKWVLRMLQIVSAILERDGNKESVCIRWVCDGCIKGSVMVSPINIINLWN